MRFKQDPRNVASKYFFIWSHLKILDHYNFLIKILRSPIAILVRAEVLAMKFRRGLLDDYCDDELANDDWEIKFSTSPAKD